MRDMIVRALLVLLIASLTTEAAVASEHRRARAKGDVAPDEQWRNSNAYVAPVIGSPPSYRSNIAEAAMTSGIAGH